MFLLPPLLIELILCFIFVGFIFESLAPTTDLPTRWKRLNNLQASDVLVKEVFLEPWNKAVSSRSFQVRNKELPECQHSYKLLVQYLFGEASVSEGQKQ